MKSPLPRSPITSARDLVRDIIPESNGESPEKSMFAKARISVQPGYSYQSAPLANTAYESANLSEQKLAYDMIVEKANVSIDIAADCWGALFFVIVCDFPAIKTGTLSCVGLSRLFFSVCVFCINLFIQGILLYFIFTLLMMPSILSAQNVYKLFIEKTVTGGSVDLTAFNQLDRVERREVCGLALSQAIFARVVLFLWVTTNVGELKNNWKNMIATLTMPLLPDGLPMQMMTHDVEATKDVEIDVVCLNRGSKALLALFIFVPKFVIALLLTSLGCVWLMAAETISDLILNSLALAFVVQVDELLAEVFFPDFYLCDLHNLTLATPESNDEPAVVQRNMVKQFFVSSLTICITASLVELAMQFQPVIPNYNAREVTDACFDYLKNQVPWCMPWQMDCFPEAPHA